MEKKAFEVGFEKQAFGIIPSLVRGVGQFGRNISAASARAPKFMQGTLQNVGGWIRKNPTKATGVLGGTAALGTAAVGAKLLGGGTKTAFEAGFAKQASNFAHAAELAGLGILAAPSVSEMRGKDWNPKAKAGAEIAGLGVLAVPSAAHFLSKSKKMAPYLKHLV